MAIRLECVILCMGDERRNIISQAGSSPHQLVPFFDVDLMEIGHILSISLLSQTNLSNYGDTVKVTRALSRNTRLLPPMSSLGICV